MMQPGSGPRRHRVRYVCWILATICAGLALRSGKFPSDSAAVKYGGDALWALVVFLCLGVLRPCSATHRVGAAALCLSWSVEFLQLYHAPWIDAIRAHVMGHLILGASFNPPDLLAYGAGVLVGMVAERLQDARRHPAENRL